MKRFLILLILIVFVTVSCAGPNKAGWTKRDFRQDEFEKDHKDCLQAVKVNPEQTMSVEECLAKKGYESEPSTDEEKGKTAEVAKTVGKVLLTTVLVAALVAAIAGYVVVAALAGVH